MRTAGFLGISVLIAVAATAVVRTQGAALQTVIVDSKGFVWVAGTAAQDSIEKYTKDGKLVWDRKVYVGERGQNRIEVFTTDGKFLQEFYVSPNTPSQKAEDCGGLYSKDFPPCGTTYKLAISRDPQQKCLYVADGTNDKVWILDRFSGKTIGSFGRNGTYAGQFHWINAVVMDSKGNLYTGEVEENKRIQKFVPVMQGVSR
jgi:hypothetical protein